MQYRERGYRDDIIIPHEVYYDGKIYTVNSIGKKAFYNCSRLTTVLIPDGVYEIKAEAFKGCTGLTEVIIGSGIHTFGSKAFAGCTSLMNFTIYNSSYPNYYSFENSADLFEGSSLSQATLHVYQTWLSLYREHHVWKQFGTILPIESAETTGFMVNDIYYKITNENYQEVAVVAIPESRNTKYKGTVIIPEKIYRDGRIFTVTSIGNEAFRGCTELTKVVVPDGVTHISTSAFEGCTALQQVLLGSSVRYFGTKCFAGCTALNAFYIYNADYKGSDLSTTSDIFEGSSLEQVTLYVYMTNYTTFSTHDVWKQFGNIELIDAPENSTFPYQGVYYYLYDEDGQTYARVMPSPAGTSMYYGRVTIPEKIYHNGAFYEVRSIADEAFRSCNFLKEVTIPATIREIGSRAFNDCTQLTSFTCLCETLPKLAENVFIGSTGATLYVPESVLDLYTVAAQWSGFQKIKAIPDDSEPVYTRVTATPTITYQDGKLQFKCATPNSTFYSTISDEDIHSHEGNELTLTKTYYITVYALAPARNRSEAATATLCWIDSETEDGVIDIEHLQAKAVLITCKNRILTLNGVEAGTEVAVFDTGGSVTNRTTAATSIVVLPSNIEAGRIAIVKIGNKSVKVVIR